MWAGCAVRRNYPNSPWPGIESRTSMWQCSVLSTAPPAHLWLPLLFARSTVTFPAEEHHHPLAGAKLYCLMTEARLCEQLAQSCQSKSCGRTLTPTRITTPWPWYYNYCLQSYYVFTACKTLIQISTVFLYHWTHSPGFATDKANLQHPR